MTLHIRNMVCNRCIMAVENLLNESGFKDFKVSLGSAELNEDLDENQKETLSGKLQNLGFELIGDRKSQLIEAIKNIIIEKIHHDKEEERELNWSDLISSKLPYDYKYLSRLFSSVEGITIEQFIIHQKIEKAKELIVYNELTLSEIAWKLGYSSPAHLSSQFKSATGMTPRSFKQTGLEKRKPLDEV